LNAGLCPNSTACAKCEDLNKAGWRVGWKTVLACNRDIKLRLNPWSTDFGFFEEVTILQVCKESAELYVARMFFTVVIQFAACPYLIL